MINPNSILFSGNANVELSERIAKYLYAKLGVADITKFSDGEIRVEIESHVRGKDAYIIQPTCAPTNDNLMELLVMVDAMRRSATRSVTAIIPYYGYSRQDRRPGYTRTPITSRLVADMIEASGIDQIMTVDIHSTQQQGFFHVPVINISAAPLIIGDIWKKYGTDRRDLTIVSPDTGGVNRARGIAKQLDDANLAIIDKRRPEANVSEVMNIIGDVEDQHCVLVDDMIDTAGTLGKAATALKKHGAKSVTAYATHGVFSGGAFMNIHESPLDEVVITDTIPLDNAVLRSEIGTNKIRTITLAGLISESIRRVSNNQSISEIYTGLE